MLFANGYRYHMRSIGCPLSLYGYDVAGGYFGRYRNSLGSVNNYNTYLNWPQRRSIYGSGRRNRMPNRRHTVGEQNITRNHSSIGIGCLDALRTACGVRNDSSFSINSRIVPLISKKCLISMTSALIVLLFLGLVSTVVGGIYFQRSNHSHNFKDNIHQLLCIIAIICGIIMLLSSGVLFRVIFCKSKWRNSSSRHSVFLGSANISNTNELSTNCDETVFNLSNDEEVFSPHHRSSRFLESSGNDEPPTYSECNSNIAGLQMSIEVTPSTRPLVNTNINYSHDASITPPPKYSSEPPPRYSQLDVRTLLSIVVPSANNQNVSNELSMNPLESPHPVSEGISSPTNNSFMENVSDNVLYVEDYKLC